MKISAIHRKETGLFSQQQLDLVYDQSVYSEFLTQPFSKDAFQKQIELKSIEFGADKRTVLVNTLKEQNQSLQLHENVKSNIDALLEDTTFTVVTGHQLVAYTGPLYFIYKMAHVVKMCKELQEQYPSNKFVPVFWIASEDHDYEEIKSFHLFNRTISWETEQNGPVGRFEMKDWEPVKEQLSDLFKNHPDSELFTLMDQLNGENYAMAFRKMLHHLIGKYGVVIVDGDHPNFKEEFLPYMKMEVTSNYSFKAINATTDQLIAKGGKSQIIPKEINLFFIENGFRERLNLLEDGSIEIAGKGIYSKDEILKWMDESPASFSPNVSIRPLYQEVILPNLCYVGGAGEINYWLQLKGVFDEAKITYPLIQTRNSVMWMDKGTGDKIEKLQLSQLDLFKEVHILQKEYLAQNAGDEVDFSAVDAQMQALKMQLLETTKLIDASLESFAAAESVRIEKQVGQIKDRLYKTVKSKHDKNLKSIQQIKEKLFPANGLQERYTNFFQLNPDGNYTTTLDAIVENMQPFNGDLLIFEEQ